MSLFKSIKNNKEEAVHKFDQHDVIQEILDTKDELCPEWNFFKTMPGRPFTIKADFNAIGETFDHIKGDLLAIYTDVINKEIKIANQFSEYKRTVESVYQIVREIYITDKENTSNDSLYKMITAKSAKELFIKLKREQE